MAILQRDNIFRGGTKVGYYQRGRLFDMDDREVGYYQGNRIYDREGREKGYVQNGQVYHTDGAIFDEVEKVRQHVGGGNYSEMPCAAVGLLFGWD